MEQRKPYKPSAADIGDGMALPEGKTCGDCRHFVTCKFLISRIAADEMCDWAPSKFLPKKEKA